jgi:RND family efflux transporter, MFP subunit
MKRIIKPRNEKERKIAGYIILAVVVVVIAALVYNFAFKKDPSKILNEINADVFTVSVEKPEHRDLKHQLLTSGSLKALEEAIIFPRVSGKLLKNVLREGDKVKKGQTISLIERDEVGAKYEPVVVPSTINGVVGRVYLDPGANVTTGTPVALVVNQDKIRIAVDIPERYIGEIYKGQSAWLTVEALPDQKFQATLDIISPVVDSLSRSVAVEFRADNKESKLRSGMFAKLDISLAEQKNALSLSKKNILENADGSYYVLVPSKDKKTAEKKDIKVGFKNNDHWQVSGIDENQPVLNFVFGLKQGSPIEVK